MKKILYFFIVIFIIIVGCKPKNLPPNNYYGEWKEIVIDGERPFQRADMSIAWGGNNNLILFGSSNETDIFTNETWEFCFDNNKWTKLNFSITPPKRASYGLLSYVGKVDNINKVIMFGGLYDNAPTFLDDTWEYNVESKEWIEIEIIGDNPSPRMRHHLISIGDNKVMLFGGHSYSQKGEQINDLWEYDVISHTWTEKATNSIKPSPRQDFGLSYSPDNHCIVLFGGWIDVFLATNDTWIYDIEKDEWKEVHFNEGDVRPSPRYSMDLAYVGNNKVMLFGGECLSGDTAHPNDTWIFDLKYKVWRECIILSEDTPDSGLAYGMTTIGNKAYMFGGFYQGEANNDLWEFTLVEENSEE